MTKKNPLKLNPLQLKTLTLLQELAKDHEASMVNSQTGEVTILSLPHPHGNHFHIGHSVAFTKDASGLQNQAVWVALGRKGLVSSADFPASITLTKAGVLYETGIRDQILHGSDH